MSAAAAEEEESLTPEQILSLLDRDYVQERCLGHGGFGSVFLARKESGRQVALKCIRFNQEHLDDDSQQQEEQAMVMREVDAVLALEESSSSSNRDMAIVFLQDWFICPSFACLVLNYANGGTLAQEIKAHNQQPYTERRIAWYALQLSEALAYAHERGIAHHDVKSSNVLMDHAAGGRLLLADFDSAVAPGEGSHKFTELYAAPELMHAYQQQQQSDSQEDTLVGLQADRIDSFGLGCILFEMLSCQNLVDLTQGGEQTLAEYIQSNSVDAALDLPCIRLAWLPERGQENEAICSKINATCATAASPTTTVGYSRPLRNLVKTLLEPDPNLRWTPSELQKPLRQDPSSPLLADFLTAAQPVTSGTILTMDNIQLGLFVQRGPDWKDGDQDGGKIGVVVQLDPDAGYTKVAFPLSPFSPMVCRIGAGNQFELQVGPMPMEEFYTEPANSAGPTSTTRSNGIVLCDNPSFLSEIQAGKMVNPNCMIVAVQPHRFFVAPVSTVPPPINHPPTQSLPPTLPPIQPRTPLPLPDRWEYEGVPLYWTNVTDADERNRVLQPFYDLEAGGLDISTYKVLDIKRIEAECFWKPYSKHREVVASQHWGIVNEKRLFHGTLTVDPKVLLMEAYSSTTNVFYEHCAMVASGGTSKHVLSASSAAQFGDYCSYKDAKPDGSVRSMILSRVTMGRVHDEQRLDDMLTNRIPAVLASQRPASFPPLEYHTFKKTGSAGHEDVYNFTNFLQVYPEYLVTYNVNLATSRRRLRARRPETSPAPAPVAPSRQPVTSTRRGLDPPDSQPTVAKTPPPAQASVAPSTTPGSTASTPSKVKDCVVCLERPVQFLLVPCGHPCLCEMCATKQGLSRLGHRCPECRSAIREAVRFYGKIVED